MCEPLLGVGLHSVRSFSDANRPPKKGRPSHTHTPRPPRRVTVISASLARPPLPLRQACDLAQAPSPCRLARPAGRLTEERRPRPVPPPSSPSSSGREEQAGERPRPAPKATTGLAACRPRPNQLGSPLRVPPRRNAGCLISVIGPLRRWQRQRARASSFLSRWPPLWRVSEAPEGRLPPPPGRD